MLRAISPVTVKAGASVNVNLAGAFEDPEGAALTYSASLGAGSFGPVGLGITISGSVMNIASPAAMRTGPVSITITASDPFGLFVVQVLTVTVQPADTTEPPEPPVDDVDGCVTVSRSTFSPTTNLERISSNCDYGETKYFADMTNRCSYRVEVRFGFYPQYEGQDRSDWGNNATGLAPGANYQVSRRCGLPPPDFRFCVYRSGSNYYRCYREPIPWQSG